MSHRPLSIWSTFVNRAIHRQGESAPQRAVEEGLERKRYYLLLPNPISGDTAAGTAAGYGTEDEPRGEG